VDHDAVNRLQTEISLLKRGIEDLREEFRALKSVLIESETRWRWKSVASGRAV
jgi:glutamate 5-kinase